MIAMGQLGQNQFTEAERATVAELVDAGLSMREIATKMGRGQETVRRWAYRLRPELKIRRKAWEAEGPVSAQDDFVAPDDIGGLWDRAMRAVRRDHR